MAKRISSDPRPPIAPFPAASTPWSAVDAAREGGCAAPAVAGSWIDGDAGLDRECKHALRAALAAEEDRLRGRAAAGDERLAELEAQMHLALARGREDRARAAILQIISERRRSRALAGAIAGIRRERARLASALVCGGDARSRLPGRNLQGWI